MIPTRPKTALQMGFRLNSLEMTLDDHIPTDIELSKFTGRGSVLLSCPGEFNHFLIKAAVFIYEHNERGSAGVILEKPSAFTMGESSPNIGVFEGNTLYMGGEDGSDTAIMLHKFDLDGNSKYIGNGIYLGGIRQAREMVTAGKAVPKDFKFFFNHVEWAPGILDEELEQGRWNVVKVPPDLILKQSTSSSLWRIANNLVPTKEKMNTPEANSIRKSSYYSLSQLAAFVHSKRSFPATSPATAHLYNFKTGKVLSSRDAALRSHDFVTFISYPRININRLPTDKQIIVLAHFGATPTLLTSSRHLFALNKSSPHNESPT
eukprot:gene6298-12743_t